MKTKLVLACFVCTVFATSTFAQENSSKTGTANVKRFDYGITREKLLQTKTVEDLLDGFPINEWEVISYKLTIITKGLDPAEFESNNNQFTDAMKEKIKLIQAGSLIYIEYVKGKLKNSHDGSSTRSFPPASYVLVEK